MIPDEDDKVLASEMADRLTLHLYHYMALDDPGWQWLSHILQASELHFSKYADLNDPFEGDVPWKFDEEEGVVRRYWQKFVDESEPGAGGDVAPRVEQLVSKRDDPAFREALIAAARDEIRNYGVACFSEIADDLLMWAYYASGHKGACLCFRTEELLRSYGIDRGLLVPVTYQSEYPHIAYYRSGYVRRVCAVIGTKSIHWRHEREWRIVLPGESGSQPFRPAALVGIILGSRTTTDDRDRVRRMTSTREPPVNLLLARRRQGEYGVEIVAAS